MFVDSYCEKFFGKRLKEIRKKSGLSQETLAQELGISKSALSYYESGERTPDITVLDKVCQYYNVSLDYLMGYSDAMNPEKAPIVDKTGLSEETVEILMNEFDDGYISNVLDKLLKSEDFRKALSILECESHSSHGHRNNFCLPFEFQDLSPSYSAFLIEKLIMTAVSSVLDDRSAEISQKIFNSLLSKQEQEKYIQWLISPNRADTVAERIKALDKENEERRNESIRQWKEETETRNKALEKLHSTNKKGDD